MSPERSRRIKAVIRDNFDLSPDSYEEFERRSGLFASLARRLASLAGIRPGDRILDVGCGTGDSTLVLASLAGPEGLVVGLDISRGMLRSAAGRAAGPGSSRILWVQCDAERPECLCRGTFDAVLYNACAFLLPEPARSLGSTSRLLSPGGRVGITVLAGLVDPASGDDVVERLRRETRLGLGRGTIVAMETIRAGLERAVGGVRAVSCVLEVGVDVARAFYAIPAQSNALFPGRPLEERLSLASALFDHLGRTGSRLGLSWEILVGGTEAA